MERTPSSHAERGQLDLKQESGSEKETQYRSEIFDPKNDNWEDIRENIFELMKLNWGEDALSDPNFTPEAVEKFFKQEKNINVLLRASKGEIIGYSMAVPDEDEKEGEAAYIDSTDIHPSYQHKGLIGKIMEVMEGEMKKRGYQYMTRDSAIENGYAEAIEKHYGERIVDKKDHESKYGRQRYFKIKL